jgi:hypothetical protein
VDIVTSVIVGAAVVGLGISARQLALQTRALGLQTKALGLQTDAFEGDRLERVRQRLQRRTTLFAALRAELREIQSAADADYVEYRGEQRQSDRIRQEGDSLADEGMVRHRLGFPWSPLPDDTIAQAISEGALLGLEAEQIEKLLALRGRIRRVDTLVRYKVGLYPALIQANITREQSMDPFHSTRHWAEGRAAHLNNALEAAVSSIAQECKAILNSWHFE